MKKDFLFAAIALQMVFALDVQAQNLTVFHIAGKVESFSANGKAKTLKLKDQVTPSTIISVPYEGMVELIDERNAKRYTIKAPGKGSVQSMSQANGNSMKNVTAQYVSYVQKQMGNSAQVTAAQKFTDFTTVTRDKDSLQTQKKKQLTPREEFELERLKLRDEFAYYRKKAIQEYNDHVRQAWEEFNAISPIPQPEERKVEPVVFSEDEQTNRLKIFGWTKKAVSDLKNSKVIKYIAHKVSQPKPSAPIQEVEEKVENKPVPENLTYMPFTYYGTEMKVRLDETKRIRLGKISNSAIADALDWLSSNRYDNTLRDCLSLREEYGLCDWAYLGMLQTLSEEFCGSGTNEATLLTGWLFTQSGYKMRFATDNTKLYILVGTDHRIYNRCSFELNGVSYYPIVDDIPDRLSICPASMPKEQGLVLFLPPQPKFALNASDMRTITPGKKSDFSIDICVNKNLIDFYNTYPTFDTNHDVLTRWAMYANTPLDEHVKNQLYPQMKKLLEGKSKKQAVGQLLSWIQYGFPYEFDTDVWGMDRAFFAEETLFYKSCDCEDRSILLTRLVRDLLDLKCVLIYYPGHLATGINFKEYMEGDSFELENETYTVCDPTYIGAGIGMQMPGMDVDAAQLILLE